MADTLLEGVAAKNRKHNAHIPARSATMSHKSATPAFTCSMWHAHTRALPHAAQLSESSRFARNSRLEPQLALRGRHCCNEGVLPCILAGWIDDRSSSTPTRAAQLSNQPCRLSLRAAMPVGVPTSTTARRLVDQDAPRIQRGSFGPTKLSRATQRPQLRRHEGDRSQRHVEHERPRLTTGGRRLRSVRRSLIF